MARRSSFRFPVLRRMPPLLVPLVPFQIVRFHGRCAVHGRIATGAAVTYDKKNRQFCRPGPERVSVGSLRHGGARFRNT